MKHTLSYSFLILVSLLLIFISSVFLSLTLDTIRYFVRFVITTTITFILLIAAHYFGWIKLAVPGCASPTAVREAKNADPDGETGAEKDESSDEKPNEYGETEK